MAKENGGVIGVLNTPSTTTASGVWALQDQYEAKRNGTWPLTPFVGTNSLRFNAGSSDYLNRTYGTPTNNKIWTLSFWVKRTELGREQHILNGGGQQFYFSSGDVLAFGDTGSTQLVTSQVFRDVSAWYHIVIAVDTTQATSTNRDKIYVNGTQVTSFSTSTYPAQNSSSSWNTASTAYYIGIYNPSPAGYYWSTYLSEFNFIDGQQLTPSSFGASNASGVWYPIPYAGSYGTNGFNLKFTNSASLGADSSPNGNNFTVNNLTSVDQSTDTELNNFSTMNPLRQPTGNPATLTNGNLTVATNTSAGYYGGRSTIGVSSGKWYFEAKLVSYDTITGGIGIQNAESYTPEMFNSGQGAFAGYSSTGWTYYTSGPYTNNNTDTSYGNSFAAGDIISVALDCDNAKLYFAKNGTWQNSGVPTSGATGTGAISITSGLTYLFAVDDTGSTRYCVWDCNFGSPPYAANSYADGNGYGNFSYAVPSGYYALCTANLNTYG